MPSATPVKDNAGLKAFDVTKVDAGYNGSPVVRDVSLDVAPGEVVALLGANGAGKTTLLLTMAGELKQIDGTISMWGKETKAPLFKRARQGLRLITEERSVFVSLTVSDNLRLAHNNLDRSLELFPELERLLTRKAGMLSGGEQQMLALACALAGDCRILLVDELSLGLAPIVVDRLLSALRAAADGGTAVVLVEQSLERALKVSDRAYVLQRGRMVLHGKSAEIATRREEVEAMFLS